MADLHLKMFVEGNTQFTEDALNASSLKKFLEGSSISYDKNTVRPGRISTVSINTNASGGSAGTYTVLHSQTTYSGNGANGISSQLQMMVLQMYQFQSLTAVLIIQQVKLLQYSEQSAVLVAT